MKIEKQLISLKQEASTWEEAIRVASISLKENGYIEERYVNALIDGVKKLGPYIVIAPGLAIPHSRPEDGTIKMGMSLTTFKEPIYFKENDERYSAKVFLTISAVDNDSHLQLLSSIAEKLNDDVIETLEEIEDILK